MKLHFKLLIAFVVIIALTSCTNHLIGTWSIQKYQTNIPEHEGVVLTNIGTMTFQEDGSGSKQLDYTIMDNAVRDDVPFKWISTSKYVTIDSQNSEFAKTWIIIESSQTYQKWNSTDNNTVQTIELRKNK